MNIIIDRQGKLPIQEQVRLEIAQRIRSGLLEPEQALPPVRQLARDAGISLLTAHRVYKLLAADKLIYSVPGKGTFVGSAKTQTTCHTPPPAPFNWQLSIPDLLPRASYWSQSMVRLPADFLDLATASIHPTLLPLSLLQSSIQQALQKHPQALGRYAPYQGDEDFLQAICAYLKNQGIAFRPPQLIVTNGTQQGLDLFARTFLGPADTIALETPCFSSAIDVFRFCRCNIQPIPVDQEGIRLDILEEVSSRIPLKAIYTVPTHQNPTGSVMSLQRRRGLLEFATHHNLLILEDDPHRELSFANGRPPADLALPIKSLDLDGRVIYLKGFSKFLFPGFRLGIMVADGSIYNRLLAAKSISDLGSPLWLQKALTPFFTNPQLPLHIKKLNRILAQRSQLVIRKLSSTLHPCIKYQRIQGGMHLWLTLPPEISANSLLTAAHQHRIHFLPGSIFYPGEPEFNHLRICWTNLSDTDLPEALDRLCHILNRAVSR